MKIKKRVLGLLLSAFIFIALHDFVIGYIDRDTQIELSLFKIEKIPLCEASTIHELIHSSMMTTLSDCIPCHYHDSMKQSLYIESTPFYNFLNYHKLFRPPIA